MGQKQNANVNRTVVTVSCKGTDEYKDALSILVRKLGTSMGRLVRGAIDKEYGDKIETILESLRSMDITAKDTDKNAS